MTVNEFLSRLQGVTSDGKDGWMACCPAHDDADPSMHVSAGRDGRILVKCFAGCSTEAIVRAMGLKMSDLMAEIAAPVRGGGGHRASAAPAAAKGKASAAPRKRRPSKHVCYYDYEREDGAIEFRVDRRIFTDEKGGKTFVQMSPDPEKSSGWAFGVASRGVKYIPFRLPSIVQAAANGKPVVVLEGEKDVLTMVERLGMVATCNAKGAGKWGTGWGKWFAGVPAVLIIADKDPETAKDEKTGEDKVFAVGQRHACDVEAKLRADGYKGKIRKACLPDVAGRHVKDFTDWVEAMDAEGRQVDRASFKAALDEFGEWPAAWEFGGFEVNAAPAGGGGSSGGDSAPDMPGEDHDGGEEIDAPGADGRGCGRFGRLVRAPAGGTRIYEVDFRLSGLLTVRLEVGVGHYRSSGFMRNRGEGQDAGRYRRVMRNEPLELSLCSTFAMAAGTAMRLGGFDPDFKFSARLSSELTSIITLLWLRSRGKFFWDENAKGFATSLFFDEKTGVLMRVRSDEFAAFVATEAEMNRESTGFRYLMALIDDAAMSDQVAQGVTPSNMWDRRGDAVYVSSGDAEMYRIAGGRVVKVQNGTDGVVFMRGKTLAPWELAGDGGVDPFAEALIFKGASWADGNGCMNVRLWVLNLFACHATKPLLLITGAMQSGKTRMAKGIKEILGVRQDGRLDLSVQQVEDGEKGLDAFWATVNDGRLEVFDNLDTKIKWVADTLQNVATDGQTKRRTLYTTFGVSILRANAHIILTSNNPLFSTEGNGGMADRLISVHLDTNRSVAMDTELSEDIRRNRDRYMTWIARTVAAALADTGEVDGSINRRHPDYGRFSVRCGRAFGAEAAVVAALGAAEADKSLLPLRNDMITKEILKALEAQYPPWEMKFTAGEMSALILDRMGGDEVDDKSRLLYGSRRVGRAMAKYWRQFAVIFTMREPRVLDGRTLYEVAGLTPAGRMAIAGEVGKVGLEGTSTQSTRIQESAHALSPNGGNNPLNPLHAHAPDSSSSFREEEEERKRMMKEESEGPDDADIFF